MIRTRRPRRVALPRELIPTEHQEQAALVEWAERAHGTHPELRLLAAVPNGGARHKAVAAKLKAEGVRPGYPDLLLDVARGGFHGLRIELKRRDGGRVSEDQSWWHERLRIRGYRVEVCRGWEAARDVILEYLREPATRIATAGVPGCC